MSLTKQEIRAIRKKRRWEGKMEFHYGTRTRFFSALLKEKMEFPIVCAEVGIDMGHYVQYLVDALKDDVSMMYGIDSFRVYRHYSRKTRSSGGRAYRPRWAQKDWDNLYLQVVEKFSCYNNVLILRSTSEEASWIVPDGLHYVFIDAGHDYHNVINDIHLWEEKIVNGGILSGHDYKGKKYKDVTVAVDDYARRFGRKVENPILGCWYWEVRK